MNILKPWETGFGQLIEMDGHIDPAANRRVLGENHRPVAGQPVLIDCILQKSGVENRNGRWYPHQMLEREAAKYMELVNSGSAVGESDHPESTTVSLHNLSHRLVKMWWKGNVLHGTLELIVSPGYAEHGGVYMPGDKIMVYLSMGIRIGISSRGMGTLKEVMGKKLVQDDFELICWDLVTSPSTPGAYLMAGNAQPDRNAISEHAGANTQANGNARVRLDMHENPTLVALRNFLNDN